MKEQQLAVKVVLSPNKQVLGNTAVILPQCYFSTVQYHSFKFVLVSKHVCCCQLGLSQKYRLHEC